MFKRVLLWPGASLSSTFYSFIDFVRVNYSDVMEDASLARSEIIALLNENIATKYLQADSKW